MTRFHVVFLLVFLCASSAAQDGRLVTFLFTNDLHSRLTGCAPESSYTPLTLADDSTTGGFARIASIFKKEREKSEGPVFTVDAGDFMMGTLFQSLEPSTGFQLGLMRQMGYDAVALGNHEFDYGPDKLADIISSATDKNIPAILLSNAVFSEKDLADDRLTALFEKTVINRKVIIERGGVKAGFFSLLGKVADDNAAFAPPVTFARQVSTARKMVKDLQDEGCDIIVCLSHSGVTPGKNGEWEGEDVELARKVKGLDVIISGHTHTRLEKPVMVNGIPIVQTGEYGQYTGKLTVSLKDGNVGSVDYELIAVDDDVRGDNGIHELIEKQKNEISLKVLGPADMDYYSPVAESGFRLECNEQGDFKASNLGPLVADAIHNYVNENCKSGTDVSMVAVGVIRDKIVPGILTAPDVFRIMSMGMGEDNIPGYPLARLYVTGKELKSILEILQVAYKSTPANYCFYAGIKVDYDPSRGLLNKVRSIEITGNSPGKGLVDFSKKNDILYSITANVYMLEFIGIIKKMSFGLINVVPKDMDGKPITDMKDAIIDIDETHDGLQEGKEWLAIMNYIRSMKDLNSNGIPDIDPGYRSVVPSAIRIIDNNPVLP